MAKKQEQYNGWTNRETWAYQLQLWNNYETCKMLESWKSHLTVMEIEQRLRNHLQYLKSIAEVSHKPNEARHIIMDIGDTRKVNFLEIARSILS